MCLSVAKELSSEIVVSQQKNGKNTLHNRNWGPTELTLSNRFSPLEENQQTMNHQNNWQSNSSSSKVPRGLKDTEQEPQLGEVDRQRQAGKPERDPSQSKKNQSEPEHVTRVNQPHSHGEPYQQIQTPENQLVTESRAGEGTNNNVAPGTNNGQQSSGPIRDLTTEADANLKEFCTLLKTTTSILKENLSHMKAVSTTVAPAPIAPLAAQVSYPQWPIPTMLQNDNLQTNQHQPLPWLPAPSTNLLTNITPVGRLENQVQEVPFHHPTWQPITFKTWQPGPWGQ